MLTISSLQLRNQLQEMLQLAAAGQKIAVTYRGKVIASINPYQDEDDDQKPKDTRTQAQKIIDWANDPKRLEKIAKIKQENPQLFNMTPQEEKKYIRNLKANKYGV